MQRSSKFETIGRNQNPRWTKRQTAPAAQILLHEEIFGNFAFPFFSLLTMTCNERHTCFPRYFTSMLFQTRIDKTWYFYTCSKRCIKGNKHWQRICVALWKTLDIFDSVPKVSSLPIRRHYDFPFVIGVDWWQYFLSQCIWCSHQSRERAIVRKAHAVCFPRCSHALSRPRVWSSTKIRDGKTLTAKGAIYGELPPSTL